MGSIEQVLSTGPAVPWKAPEPGVNAQSKGPGNPQPPSGTPGTAASQDAQLPRQQMASLEITRSVSKVQPRPGKPSDLGLFEPLPVDIKHKVKSATGWVASWRPACRGYVTNRSDSDWSTKLGQ